MYHISMSVLYVHLCSALTESNYETNFLVTNYNNLEIEIDVWYDMNEFITCQSSLLLTFFNLLTTNL